MVQNLFCMQFALHISPSFYHCTVIYTLDKPIYNVLLVHPVMNSICHDC